MGERERGGGGFERLEVEKNGGGDCGDLGGLEKCGGALEGGLAEDREKRR